MTVSGQCASGLTRRMHHDAARMAANARSLAGAARRAIPCLGAGSEVASRGSSNRRAGCGVARDDSPTARSERWCTGAKAGRSLSIRDRWRSALPRPGVPLSARGRPRPSEVVDPQQIHLDRQRLDRYSAQRSRALRAARRHVHAGGHLRRGGTAAAVPGSHSA